MIPEGLPEKMAQRIRNMVIVMAGDEARVITCYRSEKGMMRIKKKSCRLSSTYECNNVALK